MAISWGQRVATRDGTCLSANVYLPRPFDAPRPAILLMTPYVADGYHARASYYARRGLPFVVADVRGRGNSEGRFAPPSINQPGDSRDMIEWVAGQDFCDGRVVMIGGSYCGYCQWAAIKDRPPQLVAIAPTAAPFRGVDSPMRSNIFFPERIQWLMFTNGRTAQPSLFGDGRFWSELFRDWYRSGDSFASLSRHLGARADVFLDWLAHPEPDAHWDQFNPTDEDYAALDLPVLSITGIFDDVQPGAIEHYRRHMAALGDAAPGRHNLVIGPWDHVRASAPAAEFGGLRIGEAGLIDLLDLHLAWVLWVVGCGARPDLLRKPVAYYVTGAEKWRWADSLAEVTATRQSLFLASDGPADFIGGAGRLDWSSCAGGPDNYVFDPRDTDAAWIEAEAAVPSDSLVDQEVAHALSGRALFYETAPFEEELEVSGFFEFEAWFSIDRPDTDIFVSVYAVDPTGDVVRLSTDAVRARYREGLRKPRLIETTEPLPYRFAGFTFTSRLLQPGDRLRLMVSPVGRLFETNFAQKNYNAGGEVARETAAVGRPVAVTLHHDQKRASVLRIPIGAGGD